jgi:hypothetical protein
MIDENDFKTRVSELRRAFDANFSERHPEADLAVERFLAVRACGALFAFRLSEIAGVAVDRKLTPLPTPVPELLGLTGVRGRLVPVYSLTALLGGAAESDVARWLVLVAEGRIALATQGIASYLSGHARDLVPSSRRDDPCPETLTVAGDSYGVVGVPSLVKNIAARVAAVRPRQEQ